MVAILAAGCVDDPAGPGAPDGDGFDPVRTSLEFAALRAELYANHDVAVDLAYVRPVLDTPLLPEVLGTTFEWDESADAYVTTERAGAPPDGVRFILYDRTAAPLAEVGFVDVTGEGDGPVDPVGVHLEKRGITRLDYDLGLGEPGSGNGSVAGFLTDGTERVDFDVLQVVSTTSGGFRIDLDHSMALESRPLTVRLDYSLNFGLFGSDDRLTATFVDGDDILVIDFTGDPSNGIDGDVKWNGDVVMTVTGVGQPVFRDPQGEDLTAPEAQAIRSMFELAANGVEFLLPYLILLDDEVG